MHFRFQLMIIRKRDYGWRIGELDQGGVKVEQK